MFQPQPKHQITPNNLPVQKYREQIIHTILNNTVTIICGQTSSGKTTQIPQFLYNSFRNILISQPRRISAITLAERVANEMGVNIGQQVGYNVRFEQKRTVKTRIHFVTDGMAIRQLMVGKQYDVFILDEAHERSINTDVLMAILQQKLCQKGKNRIKLVIMSATIDSSKFLNYFSTDSLITIQGRSYPTQIYNLLTPVNNYIQAMYNNILQIHLQQPPGDILSFLTGQDQIISLRRQLQKTINQHNLKLVVNMLYSALPYQYQREVFVEDRLHCRKVILATNIAETSVTIPSVRYVIDAGFMKIRMFDHHKLVDMLVVVPVSKANALQRAGRAGREAPGKCYRLYLKNSYEELEEQTSPEILRSELSGPILQLKAIGIPRIRELRFMDAPANESIDNCLKVLQQIKCITSEQCITQYGLQVSKIPLAPLLGHLLLLSLQNNCERIMLSMLAIFSIDNMFYRSYNEQQRDNNIKQIMLKYLPTQGNQLKRYDEEKWKGKGKQVVGDNLLYVSDHLAKINILEEYMVCRSRVTFCKQNMLNRNNMKRAVLIRQQLANYLGQIVEERSKKEFIKIQKTVVTSKQSNTVKQSTASFTRIQQLDSRTISNWLKCMQRGCLLTTAKLQPDGRYLINHTGQLASIHPQSLCFQLTPKPGQIIFNQLVKTSKIYLKDITPL